MNNINIGRKINKINIGMKINEINIGRKNTSSQWLIPFRKIWLCKLPLQRGGILVAFNNLSLAMAL